MNFPWSHHHPLHSVCCRHPESFVNELYDFFIDFLHLKRYWMRFHIMVAISVVSGILQLAPAWLQLHQFVKKSVLPSRILSKDSPHDLCLSRSPLPKQPALSFSRVLWHLVLMWNQKALPCGSSRLRGAMLRHYIDIFFFERVMHQPVLTAWKFHYGKNHPDLKFKTSSIHLTSSQLRATTTFSPDNYTCNLFAIAKVVRHFNSVAQLFI